MNQLLKCGVGILARNYSTVRYKFLLHLHT